MPEVVVPSYDVGFTHTHTHTHTRTYLYIYIIYLFHIYIYTYDIPGKLGFLSFITMQSCDACNKVRYDPMVIVVCVQITLHHYHYCADLYESLGLLKCFSSAFCLEWVSNIKSILILPISFMKIFRICVLYLIIIKSHVWPICHCVGLGHETMVCALCLFVFLFNTPRTASNIQIRLIIYVELFYRNMQQIILKSNNYLIDWQP